MKMEFSCQYDVHFSRIFVLHRCVLGSVLISVSWGSLLEIVGQIDISFLFGSAMAMAMAMAMALQLQNRLM
jgi:hypothetical protein